MKTNIGLLKETQFRKIPFLISLLCLTILLSAATQACGNNLLPDEKQIPKLENPITVEYLKSNLLKTQPRLVLNADLEKLVKAKLKSDPVIQNMYKAIQLNAVEIQKKPMLERKLEGRRLLGVSREMLYRINMLGMVYRMEKRAAILDRINKEVIAVCNFTDWNPSHYLDVAEMSMAVAIALDWTAGKLPKSTIELAKTALIEKGIKPSWPANGKNPGWAYGTNNWNQVCNGGMIAASIAIAEKDPELAAKTIHRALDGMVHSLAEYSPDGVYPEGSTYWAYGTSFSVVTSAMLESAFGTDFGIADYPAFKKSAVFRVFKDGAKPEATFDLTAVYGENLKIATRRFAKEDNRSILIEDHFSKTDSTQSIVWQMMTTADVEIVKGGAILRQDGKELKLDNLANPELQVSVIQLDPPPFYLDRKMNGLKRIEIRMPAYLLKSGEGMFKVRLSGK